ncbi:MAG: DUF167 domain-containing protein [Candidatus Bilamarchaeaceae archaeon]
MQIEITVVPNSPRFKIVKKGEDIKVYVRAQPEKNRANAELIKEFESLFGRPVRIVSGMTSRRKTIEIPVSESEFEKCLSKIS